MFRTYYISECISKTYTKAEYYKKIHLVDLNRFCSFAVNFGRSVAEMVAIELLCAYKECRVTAEKRSKVMQVFIVGSPLETAQCMDRLRLNKQILECRQILDALNGVKAWSNHPCVLQYRGCEWWLRGYLRVLECHIRGNTRLAAFFDVETEQFRPDWHTQEYYDQMKRRLYTKDPQHYAQWAHLGESVENWYFVEGEWRKYVNGKRIE